jgi:hypothetical protein
MVFVYIGGRVADWHKDQIACLTPANRSFDDSKLLVRSIRGYITNDLVRHARLQVLCDKDFMIS